MFGFLFWSALAVASAFGLRFVKAPLIAVLLGLSYGLCFAVALSMLPLPTGGWWGLLVSVVGVVLGVIILCRIVDFKKLLLNVSGRIMADKESPATT